MKKIGKIKFIFISLILIILIFTLIVKFTDVSSSKLRGDGLECFKECAGICTELDKKVVTWSAINQKCSCVCSETQQMLFEI